MAPRRKPAPEAATEEIQTPVAQEDLRIEYHALDEVARWPRNPKKHDHDGIAQSFSRFGYVDPLILDETSGRLVSGHGRIETLQAARAAGSPPPARVKVREDGQWMVPVIRGVRFASEREAEAYLVGTNQLTINGGYDDALLASLLADHRGEDGLAGMGWSEDRAADLIASVAKLDSIPPPEREPPAEFKDFDADSKKTVACPKCGFHLILE